MEARKELNDEFSSQRRYAGMLASDVEEKYIRIARGYAEIENALVVLSILDRNESIVIHGKFSDCLDIDKSRCCGRISSIWEDEIFKAVHPDDLEMKIMQELLFYHHVNRQHQQHRFDRCLMQRLRMKGANGQWTDTLHRLYYIPDDNGRTIRFALCLYGPMTVNLKAQSVVLDTLTGDQLVLDNTVGKKILSKQEIEVLKLIDSGHRSKGVAEILNISIHTVSRHRQNIIAKLNVRNSTEACKIARNLTLI